MESVAEVPLFGRHRSVHHNPKAVQSAIPDFSIVQYNVLHDIPKSCTGYSYCPDQYMFREERKDSYRHRLLLDELQWLNSDIMCLQEVDLWQFECLQQELHQWGYSGEFAAFSSEDTSHQGIAIFYRNNKFELVCAKKYELGALIRDKFVDEEKDVSSDLTNRPEVFQAVALRFKERNCYLVVGAFLQQATARGRQTTYILGIDHEGNIHVLWGEWLHTITQAIQVAMATQTLDSFVTSVKRDIGEGTVGHVLSGDFNAEPHFPLYHLLSEGELCEGQSSRLQTVDYIKWSSMTQEPPETVSAKELTFLKAVESILFNPLKTLKSAYKCIMGKEPEISNHEGNGDFWALDYIWFSSDSLQPLSVLSVAPKSDIDPYGGLPNESFPSDHLSLKATFRFS